MTIYDKDKIVAAAKEAGIKIDKWGWVVTSTPVEKMERFYAIAFEAGQQVERKECAKACEEQTEGFAATSIWDEAVLSCARAISARSAK